MSSRADAEIAAPVDQNLANTALTSAEVDAKLDAISYLSEGLNGPNTFSVESAAYGYIERHKRLVVPEDLRAWVRANKESWESNDSAAPISSVALFSFMYWNYARLCQGGYPSNNALFVAAYRTRLLYMGYLYETKELRSVTIDEVDYTAKNRSHHHVELETNKEYAKVAQKANSAEEELKAYLDLGSNDKFKRFLGMVLSTENADVLKFLALASNQFAAATYLVFRQHGHHYTPDLDRKLNVLWKATTIEQSPKYPGNEAVHRDAVHSFGMKALHDKFFYCLSKGKLAETFVDRSDVAPAGTAMIATCWATINLMRSLPIWAGVYAQYKEQIDTLEDQARKLKSAEEAIKYHKNAKLFGVNRFTMNTEVAQALAPIAMGFIQSLGDEADLAQQKTLTKRAQQNPLMTSLTYGVIRTVVNRISKSGEIAQVVGSKKTPKAPKRPAIEGGSEEESEEEPIVA